MIEVTEKFKECFKIGSLVELFLKNVDYLWSLFFTNAI